MKTRLIVIGSVAGGLLLGIGSTLFEHQLARGNLGREDPQAVGNGRRPQLAPPGAAQPAVEVDQEVFDFGVMERGATRSHAFLITNRGDYPLELRAGSTSCKCTIAKFDERTVAPGETTEIVLEWTTRDVGSTFREIAPIFTNDRRRRRLDLTVQGRLVQTLRLDPSDILFGKIPVDVEKTVEVRLFSYRKDNLEIQDSKFDDLATSQLFDVAFEPIPPDRLSDPDAKSGVLISLTAKPGLPIGPFRGRLELTTNLGAQDTLKVFFQGQVASDISVVGPGWNDQRGMLSIGRVKSSAGAKRKLTLFIRGDSPAAIQFEAAETSPDFLRVTFGEKTEIRRGRVVKLPLTIEIPPGVDPINRLGTQQADPGQILIRTNHPRARQLRLLVRFAVER